jgi:hypothetical protein
MEISWTFKLIDYLLHRSIILFTVIIFKWKYHFICEIVGIPQRMQTCSTAQVSFKRQEAQYILGMPCSQCKGANQSVQCTLYISYFGNKVHMPFSLFKKDLNNNTKNSEWQPCHTPQCKRLEVVLLLHRLLHQHGVATGWAGHSQVSIDKQRTDPCDPFKPKLPFLSKLCVFCFCPWWTVT